MVLVHPQIAPNTGNVMRLCANTGARLHLVRPLGFTVTDRRLARAGLDYRDRATVSVHDSWWALCEQLPVTRMVAVDTDATVSLDDFTFDHDAVLVFGSETTGLPDSVRSVIATDRMVRIPMVAHNRSLNLSNAVAITLYEAWRRHGYRGAT